MGIANEEDEGMIGPEGRWRWFRLMESQSADGDDRRGGSLSALLIDLSPGLVEYARNVEEPGAIDA